MNFADGRVFIGGDAPGYADCALYVKVWFQRRFAPDVLGAFPGVLAWETRVRAIGHGHPATTAAEDALALAHATTPDLSQSVDEAAAFAAGQTTTVATEDPGADLVDGTLLRLTDGTIVIRAKIPTPVSSRSISSALARFSGRRDA